MKRIIALLLVCFLVFLCGCSSSRSIPDEVEQYAKKHNMECCTVDQLIEKGIVGEQYIVYGTISYVSFEDYAEGSDAYARVLDEYKDLPDGEYYCAMSFLDKMWYTFELDNNMECDIRYTGWNFKTDYFNVNKGDKIAVIVTVEDGYRPGTYEYTLVEKIWESRTSKTTIEEEYAAKITASK